MSWRKKNTERKESLTLNVLLLSWSDLIFLDDSCLFNNKINFKNLIYCKIEEDVTIMLLYINCFELFLVLIFSLKWTVIERKCLDRKIISSTVCDLSRPISYVCVISSEKPSLPAVHFYAIRCLGWGQPNWIKHKISLRRIKR